MTSRNNTNSLKKASDRLDKISSSLNSSIDQPVKFPKFDDLPRIPGQQTRCLWGFFDKNGEKDEVGSVNLLTPDVVKQASHEIVTGQHVQLDWSLENVQFPGFGRKKFEQNVINQKPAGFYGFDDEVHFNTQSGSQWDSLKHAGHQKAGLYYNGITHDEALNSTRNGIHNWCRRGGIVGRGVLVDWVRWYEHKHGNPPSPITRHEIPVSELKKALEYQGSSLRTGDILLVRSGFVRWHTNATEEERRKGTQETEVSIGVQANEETVRWMYEQHLSAVGGDAVAFEAWPPQLKEGWCLHEWLLAAFGMPLGELWNLEDLSQVCEAEGRWSFFLTSAPLHVSGGVGSPPGAIAIF